jgi:hypothetical protein
MGERPPFLEGGNLALVILVSFLVLAAGLLWIGPGTDFLERARAELTERVERRAAWQARHAAASPISETEREQWSQSFERLRDFGAPVEDGPGLTARVASVFGGASVRNLEVTRQPPAESEEEPVVRVQAPFAEEEAELFPVSVRVGFEASLSDASRILGSLESEVSPASIQRLDMRRDFPGVRVELDLIFWTRKEVAS